MELFGITGKRKEAPLQDEVGLSIPPTVAVSNEVHRSPLSTPPASPQWVSHEQAAKRHCRIVVDPDFVIRPRTRGPTAPSSLCGPDLALDGSSPSSGSFVLGEVATPTEADACRAQSEAEHHFQVLDSPLSSLELCSSQSPRAVSFDSTDSGSCPSWHQSSESDARPPNSSWKESRLNHDGEALCLQQNGSRPRRRFEAGSR